MYSCLTFEIQICNDYSLSLERLKKVKSIAIKSSLTWIRKSRRNIYREELNVMIAEPEVRDKRGQRGRQQTMSNYLKDLCHSRLLSLRAVIFYRENHGIGRGDEGAPVDCLDDRAERNFRGEGVAVVYQRRAVVAVPAVQFHASASGQQNLGKKYKSANPGILNVRVKCMFTRVIYERGLLDSCLRARACVYTPIAICIFMPSPGKWHYLFGYFDEIYIANATRACYSWVLILTNLIVLSCNRLHLIIFWWDK